MREPIGRRTWSANGAVSGDTCNICKIWVGNRNAVFPCALVRTNNLGPNAF